MDQGEIFRYGHRNWIAIVDSAFPELISPGISLDTTESLQSILSGIQEAPHVRPEIFLDSELDLLNEDLCPGIEKFRTELQSQLEPYPVAKLPHEQIISMLDEAAKTFRVRIVKTPLAMPYTSVFIRLECGYWDAERESKMRAHEC